MSEVSVPDDLDVVADVLKVAGEYGLAAEVVLFALKALKQDPSLSLINAMYIGEAEWIK